MSSVARRRRAGSRAAPARSSIKEVAERAAVSVATVSRALNSPDVVSADTLQRIRDAIRELDYTPNAQASSLRTSRSRLLIALVPDIANPFFSEIIRGIEQVAKEHRYSVLLGDTGYEEASEDAYAEMIASRQADGLITLVPRIPRVRIDGRLPVVNACEYVTDAAISKVHVDNVAAARNAVEYLVLLGHREIAFIRGREQSPITEDRERGYRAALRAAGIEPSEQLTAGGDFSVESGIRATELLFARKRGFTAIFCSNDEMALGAMNAAAACGVRVPDDLSIVGFDDIHMARHFTPPLTTIVQPTREIGQEAARMLLEILDDPDTPPRTRILPTQLIVRGSTCPLVRGPGR